MTILDLKKGAFTRSTFKLYFTIGVEPRTEKEIFKLEELIRLFDIRKYKKEEPGFDFNKARWINHKFIERSESKSVLERFPAFFSTMSKVKSEKANLPFMSF